MKYELLAIDIDGTLVTPDQKVPPETVAAVAAARAAGIRVCLATGRSLAETLPVWRQLSLSPPHEPLVLIGGAMAAEPDTGRTLYHRVIPLDLAWEFGDALGEAGYPALAFVDAWRHGVDYCLGLNGNGQASADQWFSKMNVKVRRGRTLRELADMPDPLRIHTVVEPAKAPALEADLQRRFGGRLNLHTIVAPNYGVTVVEAFSPSADKFNAVRYVAQSHKIARGRIAAVGDDVNDLPLLQGVGLGVAMPDAPPTVLVAARHLAAAGLADFIRCLAAGEFD